jgi:hypothetical protein
MYGRSVGSELTIVASEYVHPSSTRVNTNQDTRSGSLVYSRSSDSLPAVYPLIGVPRYAAIDLSTFEALKLAYLRSTNKDEPGVLALLAFGSVSGSVGATSVYPVNLMRTRLQASGSSGHPQRYTGVWDVAVKTLERDGWRGFYRGLLPTLAKVRL